MRDLRVSRQLQEWQNEAILKTCREDLLLALEKCVCKGPVPGDLAETIQATEDMDLLSRWFRVALEANSFDEFRTAVQLRQDGVSS